MIEFKEKNKGLAFKYNGSKYMIPSAEFPLASKNKSNMETYLIENTSLVTDPKVIEIFNVFKYRVGKCYYNAWDLKLLLESNGINGWDYYSGWLFLPDELPIHHAWLIKDGQMLDYTNNLYDQEIIDLFTKEAPTTRNEYRRLIAEEIIRRDSEQASKYKVCGKVHEGYFYIGTKDTIENSQRLFYSISKNHVSYQSEGMNQDGFSETQEMINGLKKNVQRKI